MSPITFESLPVELIADILSELDLETLIRISYLSRRLRSIASDPSLNPWRAPILRNLRSNFYEQCLKQLSVRSVPRQNWVEILSIARPSFLLFESTLPNLAAAEWEECFRRRFLPGWIKWKRQGEWKEAFLKMLYHVWHRAHVTCTADEAWTKYIVLNRNGSANELESTSRNFNPYSLFDEMKLQNNLSHLETRIRLVVKLADVRILAFGTLNNPPSPFYVNPNARNFLHPPGIDPERVGDSRFRYGRNGDFIVPQTQTSSPTNASSIFGDSVGLNRSLEIHSDRLGVHRPSYTHLTHPLPSSSHINYPFYTPGDGDKRWLESGGIEEEGLQWVGPLIIVAQINGPDIDLWGTLPALQDIDLILGPGKNQYTSFSWPDLIAIAPWIDERITKKITGIGLGNEVA